MVKRKKGKKAQSDFLEQFFSSEARELPPLRHLRLDSFEREILHNMHVELAHGENPVLLSPGLMVLRPKEVPGLEEALKVDEDYLTQVKRFAMQDLVLSTAVLEGNSYYIEQNYYLTIVRFIPAGPGTYELKLYTNTRVDLLPHYSDKIYIGRDLISFNEDKKQFGLPYLLDCIKREYERLRLDARDRLRTARRFHSTLMNEIEELVEEIADNTEEFLSIIPDTLDDCKCSIEELGHINSRNRTMKHLFIELADAIQEYDSLLRTHNETDYAHYLTKFKKDVVNLINLFSIKLIPAVSRRINRDV